ncbi:MAG: PIG-L family deacetylase [Verrucomicrobiota bacterium]|nr:PIG-L family deacetylase [Verrucomicrobiota bacterium]
MDNILVIAPHPDDETLGCGGTLLRHINHGDNVYWLIGTTIDQSQGYSSNSIETRKSEIQKVAKLFGFSGYKQLKFKTTELDQYPLSRLISEIGNYVNEIKPDTIYLPYRNDVHSDHAKIFDACMPFTKSFRYPFVKKIYSYETLSETEFGLRHDDPGFKPNKWVDITSSIKNKIKIMNVYKSEVGEHPFPRSERSILSLATLRGLVCGCEYAEAFIALKDIS